MEAASLLDGPLDDAGTSPARECKGGADRGRVGIGWDDLSMRQSVSARISVLPSSRFRFSDVDGQPGPEMCCMIAAGG